MSVELRQVGVRAALRLLLPAPGGGPDAGPRLPAAAAGRAPGGLRPGRVGRARDAGEGRDARPHRVGAVLGRREPVPRRRGAADGDDGGAADDDEDLFDARDAPFGEADDDRDAAAAADRLGRRAGDAEFDAFAGAAFDAPEADRFDAPDAPLGEADDDRDADLFGRADDDRDAADTS